ncbi:hypothetical protein ACFLT5_00335 [Chloroflexota bacterium]
MGNLRIGWLVMGALAIAITVMAVLVRARYQRDLHSAQERQQGGGSQVVETDCGPIE